MSRPIDPLTPAEMAAAAGPPSPGAEPQQSFGGAPQQQPGQGAPQQQLPDVDHSYYSPPGSELGQQFQPATQSPPQQFSSSPQGYPQSAPMPAPPAPEQTGPAMYNSPQDFTQQQAPQPQRPEWMTDDLVYYAQTFGVNETDLARFGDAHTAQQNLDYWAVQQTPASQYQPQQVPVQPFDPQSPPQDMQQQQQAEPIPENEPFAGFGKDGAYDAEYWDERYDKEAAPEILSLAQQVGNHNQGFDKLRSDLEALAEYVQYTAQQQQDEHLHGLFDQMDEELFGRRYDDDGNYKMLDAQTLANRDKVKATMGAVMQTLSSQNQNPFDYPVTAIIQRSIPIALRDQLEQRQLRQRQASLATHSQQRRPVGHSAGQVLHQQGPAYTPQQQEMTAGDIANMPAISKWWNDMQQQNGNVA